MTKPYKIKSIVKRVKELDFSQQIVIDELIANKEIVDREYASFKKAYPTLSEKDIWNKINESVLKDCIFAKALTMALKSYEIKIDDEDLTVIGKSFTKQYPTFASSSPERINAFIKSTLIKDLVINDLAKYWKIEASDLEAKQTFERMYVASEGLQSVHDFIKDPATMNYVKGLIIKDKTINKLISKLKYTVDWASIKKKTDEYKAKLKAKQENNKN